LAPSRRDGLYYRSRSHRSGEPSWCKAAKAGDPAKAASALVTLTPAPISTYLYRRPIVIDHTKVPNSDQIAFPVLISGTYT